jgi:hypothetical protein
MIALTSFGLTPWADFPGFTGPLLWDAHNDYHEHTVSLKATAPELLPWRRGPQCRRRYMGLLYCNGYRLLSNISSASHPARPSKLHTNILFLPSLEGILSKVVSLFTGGRAADQDLENLIDSPATNMLRL